MTIHPLDERATRVLRGALGPLKARFTDPNEAIEELLDLAVVVARADGAIDAEERTALAAAVSTVVGELDGEALEKLLDARVEAVERVGVEVRAEALGASLLARNASDAGLVAAIAIAQASGEIGDEERRVLQVLARAAEAEDDLEPLIHQISAAVAKDI